MIVSWTLLYDISSKLETWNNSHQITSALFNYLIYISTWKIDTTTDISEFVDCVITNSNATNRIVEKEDKNLILLRKICDNMKM